MHCHIDLIGGLSGDMFIGALLDAFPEHASALPRILESAGFAELVTLQVEPADDKVLTGTKFHVHADADAHGHHHRHYSEIRRILESSTLDDATRAHALGIFHVIAVAEAKIHGKSVDDVAFHEVGAWDSIADIVCAAYLISTLDASWSVSAIPLGGGQVKTAHGMLPVPAPATALMLEEFEFNDDGIHGERVTPTGAAILKHLGPARTTPAGARLKSSGYGFGAKRFPGISNVARLMVFETAASPQWDLDQVLQLEFEIDDQTAEELAWATAGIRDTDGVLDLVQLPALGKKNRQMASIRVLAHPSAEQSVIERCFALTSTLGIRKQLVARAILRRREKMLETENGSFRVKLADRPGGQTGKAEHDDLCNADSLHERRRLQRSLEDRAKDQ